MLITGVSMHLQPLLSQCLKAFVLAAVVGGQWSCVQRYRSVDRHSLIHVTAKADDTHFSNTSRQQTQLEHNQVTMPFLCCANLLTMLAA